MRKFSFFLILLTSLGIFSCKKKEDNTTPYPHSSASFYSLYSVVHQYSGCKDSAVLYFDGDRLSTVTHFNDCPGSAQSKVKQWYVYDGGKVYVLDTSFMADKDTLTVDVALHILGQRRSNPTTGNYMVGQYRYSTQGLLESSVVYHNGPGNVPDSTQYTFKNGDLTEAVSGLGSLFYSYYDRAVPSTGYFSQNGLNYGSAFFYKNAHLLKEIRDEHNNLVESFTYDFDTDGNVLRKVSTNAAGVHDTTSYHYFQAIE